MRRPIRPDQLRLRRHRPRAAPGVVGFAVMEFYDEHAHLSLLAVAPGYQRQGIGKQLVEWLVEPPERAVDAQVGRQRGVLHVAAVVEQYIEDDVTQFLGAHGLTASDIGAFVSHPGGPKVIEAITAALSLPPDALELTWRSLGEIGNLSSASVLHVLRDTIAKKPPSGSPGLMLAMGPGFCSELVLLRWH